MELREQRRLLEQQRSVLPTVRAEAEKWSTATAGILGATGLAALLAGPGRFSELAQPYRAVASGAFLLGALAGVIALVLAARAAQVHLAQGTVSPSAQRRYEQRAISRAVAGLNGSRLLTTIAVGLVLVSACLLWMAPQKHATPGEGPPVVLRGTTSDGEVVCGSIGRDGEQPVVVTTAARHYRLMALGRIRAPAVC